MVFIHKLESIMGMSDDVWLRHANPWSVWTRFTLLPLFSLAIWSRDWIGGWAWLAVGLVLIWNWVNPRLFKVPQGLDNWASRGVLGEQIYLKRTDEVAQHHLTCLRVLMVVTIPGMGLMAWGLWRLDLIATLSGVALTMIMKTWFVDRMVWIYLDFLAADLARKHGDV
ncbi:DUF6653 family protein [Halocynthiibacter sp.]|uniref:DUF6653 family protein n=1 Tax=Halocynthiibacter sp. TaxID=1979210 RepID=UPI003C5ED4BF